MGAAEGRSTPAEVLERFTEGPRSGVFTDGSADPNPGPGGWGAVYVRDDHIVAEARGHEPDTTNNRMELQALIAGFDLVPQGEATTVYSDSNYCVRMINEWAAGWARNGWRRRTGPVKNLDLVKALYERAQQRPEIEVRWIKAHDGSRWNEYADALSVAYRRE
jgi:ribonuclease HI